MPTRQISVAQVLAGAEPVEDTLQPIVETISDVLRLDVLHVAHYARLLRRHDLLAGAGAEITPLHAARLFVAVMASQRPIDAPLSIRIFEALPATGAVRCRYAGAETVMQSIAAEDIPIPAGRGPQIVAMERSFVGAIANLIAEAAAAAGPMAPGTLPLRIEVVRDLGAPEATIVLDLENLWALLPEGQRFDAGWLKYSRSPTAPSGGPGLLVTAGCPGIVLQRLGDALRRARSVSTVGNPEGTNPFADLIPRPRSRSEISATSEG